MIIDIGMIVLLRYRVLILKLNHVDAVVDCPLALVVLLAFNELVQDFLDILQLLFRELVQVPLVAVEIWLLFPNYFYQLP